MAARKHRGSKQTVEQLNAILAINPDCGAIVSTVFANCIEFPGTKVFVTVYPLLTGYADDTSIVRKTLRGTPDEIATEVLSLAAEYL